MSWTALLAGLVIQYAEKAVEWTDSLPLGGYTARKGAGYQPGGDELRIRVALLGSPGGSSVAIVSIESLTVPESLVREVRRQLPAGVELFLAATHTHCAPDSQMWNDRMTFEVPGIARFRRAELDSMAKQIAGTIQSAQESTPFAFTELHWGQASSSFARGRRPLAQPDPQRTALQLGPVEIFHFGAHATLYPESELKLRSDWPGALMRQRPKRLALVGSIGDASPFSVGPEPGGQVANMASALGRRRMAGESGMDNEPGLRIHREPIELADPQPHPEFARSFGVNDPLALIAVRAFAPREAEITAIRIGSWVLLGVPGEPTAELGREIQAIGEERGLRVLVCSHVNGWIGYVLTPQDYQRGGYEATLSFHGPATGPRVVEATQRAIQALARPR